MPHTRRKRPGESTFGFLMLGLAGFLVWQSIAIEGPTTVSSPEAFPLAASVIMLLSAAIVVAKNSARPSAIDGGIAAHARMLGREVIPARIAIFAVLALVYAALLGPLGFLPATFLFLFAGMQFLWRKHPVRTLVLAAGSLIAAYTLFRLVFQVVLPEGIVPEREIMAAVKSMIFGGAE